MVTQLFEYVFMVSRILTKFLATKDLEPQERHN